MANATNKEIKKKEQIYSFCRTRKTSCSSFFNSIYVFSVIHFSKYNDDALSVAVWICVFSLYISTGHIAETPRIAKNKINKHFIIIIFSQHLHLKPCKTFRPMYAAWKWDQNKDPVGWRFSEERSNTTVWSQSNSN